jgi:hypothetical protein
LEDVNDRKFTTYHAVCGLRDASHLPNATP